MWGVDKARREAVRDWWQARKRGTKQQSMRPTLSRKTVKEEVTYDSKPKMDVQYYPFELPRSRWAETNHGYDEAKMNLLWLVHPEVDRRHSEYWAGTRFRTASMSRCRKTSEESSTFHPSSSSVRGTRSTRGHADDRVVAQQLPINDVGAGQAGQRTLGEDRGRECFQHRLFFPALGGGGGTDMMRLSGVDQGSAKP